MENTVVDNEIKSDVYYKSINLLVVSNAPITIQKLKTILDDNGYYGRNEIIKVSSGSDILIKVRVYLPCSVLYYEWPFGCYYNLSKRVFGPRKKPRSLINSFKLLKCMMFFLRLDCNISGKIEPVAKIASLKMGFATQVEYSQNIKFLAQSGFFKDGWFLIKDFKEVIEVHENLYDPSYYDII